MQIIDYIVMAIWGVAFLVLVGRFFQSIRLVPTKSAHIVEYLGKYDKTLEAGLHFLIPFLHKVTYVQDLKEESIDVPPQDCFSKDEVNVTVDGVIYISITDPVKASYGITDYREAAVLLAQTTTRSVIGTLELDRTFEERDLISAKVVSVLDSAGQSWGIQVHRYEIKNITPPETVRSAMEKQVNAERDRRAILSRSEGDKQARINRSEGQKAELINRSEGEKQRRINEAEGHAVEILAIAAATAESIGKIAAVVSSPGGKEAMSLQIGEQYLTSIGGLKDSKVILPANLLDYSEWMKNLGLDHT